MMILLRISWCGIFFANCDFNEIGMQTPMIHRNEGNIKSAGWMPFHEACSIQWYLPHPLFANIMVTMAKPRKASKLHSRLLGKFLCFAALTAANSWSSWLVDAVELFRLIRYCLPRCSSTMIMYANVMNASNRNIAGKLKKKKVKV